MNTYTQILYQIVFCIKNRERTLTKENRIKLYKFIWGLLQNKNCHLYWVNGVEDHIHIVTGLHPSISVAEIVKDIKVGSSVYIKEEKIFENFTGWQTGYGAFTYSIKEKGNLIEYIKNQEEHHATKSFREEFIDFLKEHQIVFDEKYLD